MALLVLWFLSIKYIHSFTLERSRRSALSFCSHGRAPELDKNCSHGSKMATDENKVTVCALVTWPKLLRATTGTDCSTKRERSRGCKLVQRWSAPEICLKNVERSSVGRVSVWQAYLINMQNVLNQFPPDRPISNCTKIHVHGLAIQVQLLFNLFRYPHCEFRLYIATRS